MASTVIVDMKTCSHKHKITVSMRDDGNMDVEIVSDCPNIQEYARNLKEITAEDAMDFGRGRINSPDVRASMSATCLCPLGVVNAAWMEMGMLSKSLCKKVHSNEIILDQSE